MKPVAIFRHSPTEGPGHFATYLDAHRIPWRLIRLDEGEPVPAGPQAYSGLCFMGGPMSVNDDLPWIAPVLELIRQAVREDVPVIGHCLGGQLMSKALGGTVSRNPVKEIGWGEVAVDASNAARAWLGDTRSFESFHWHGETFTIPPGAVKLGHSQYCANQAFVLGKHLAMQCHVEITPEMISIWCRDWSKEKEGEQDARVSGPSVQTPQEMQAAMEEKTRSLHAVADRLYARWTAGLIPG
jgi:GMP synthase-like glutamine amidotransferase